jgi:hypothetical protein
MPVGALSLAAGDGAHGRICFDLSARAVDRAMARALTRATRAINHTLQQLPLLGKASIVGAREVHAFPAGRQAQCAQLRIALFFE